MIVAKAVAVLPIWTERLDGSTAATSELAFPVVMRPILLPPWVNQSAPSGSAATPKVPSIETGYAVNEPDVVISPDRVFRM